MTFLLMEAIKTHLENAFMNMVFRESNMTAEQYRIPRIYIGALPPKRQMEEQGEDFPYIVIRAAHGEDTEDGAEATVLLLCGIYTAWDNAAGVNDIQNMVDRCRLFLIQHQVLDDRYCLELPLEWKLGSSEDSGHPHPYYHGTVTSRWRLPGVEPLLPAQQETRIFGSGYP